MLFRLEIPEIANGTIEIKGIAREAGGRTKVAVYTGDNSIDPIGSCIGQRGARIQTIIHELNGEKIDIIEYADNPAKYIANALLPAKVTRVEIDEKEKSAAVTVPQEQLSLTIGRAGQNVRLASKLTGWRISIREQETGKEVAEEAIAEKPAEGVEKAETEKAVEMTEDVKIEQAPAPAAEEPAEAAEKPSEEKPKKRGRKKLKAES
jgi:N utilization substance protein A